MSSFKVKFRASSVACKEGTLIIQVIHQRVVRQINTAYKVYSWEWSTDRQDILIQEDTYSGRIRYLVSLREALQEDLARLRLIALGLDHSRKSYLADDVVRLFLKKEQSNDVLNFAEMQINRREEEGRIPLATKYRCAVNSLKCYLGDRRISFNEIDSSLISGYEAFLKRKRLCPNTISFYMRNLRAIYNQAVEIGLTDQRNPFRLVYTGIGKTMKRAIDAEAVRRLKSLELTPCSSDELSRDLFLFSLYTRGMSLIDIAQLKKSDLKDGYLAYSRKKTGQQILIHWESCMQALVDKYNIPASPYLLPVFYVHNQESRKHYQSVMHLVNVHLKRLGKKLGFPIPLTTYVARHSWASIAKSEQVSLEAISEAMGHHSEKTTRIYLKSFEHSLVDQANWAVLRAIGEV